MNNLSIGQTVGFNVDGNIYRGKLTSVDNDVKQIQITHINGSLPEPRFLNKTITWDGPIMGLVE